MRIAVLVLFLLFSGCSSDTRTSLVVYSPHGKEMLSEYELAFEAEHPDINVQWIDMGGQDAYDRVRTERNNPVASLWWGGDSPTFSRAADEGLLEPYRPTWADAVEEGSALPLSIWVEVAGRKMQTDFEPVLERQVHHFLNFLIAIAHEVPQAENFSLPLR